MAVPYLSINSMTYSSGSVSVNTSFSYLRGGGSFSITGLSSSILYYSITASYGTSVVTNLPVSINAGTFNLTFSFFKGPYYNYPLAQPSRTGITQSASSSCGPFEPYRGGIPYNLGFATFSAVGTLYEINRTYNYTFRN